MNSSTSRHSQANNRIILLGLLIAPVLGGCVPKNSTPTTQQSEGSATPPAVERTAPEKIDPKILAERSFGEAPMLAKRVAAGELPPVSERLPEEPLVVRPLHEIGTYGGTIRRLIDNESGRTGVEKTLTDGILEFERPFGQRILPNLATGYEFQDEGRTAIFHLRKGVKWSDGQPFTAADFIFWYKDTVLDREASTNPIPDSRWLVNGKPIQAEMIDDTTLRFSADRPMGRLLNTLVNEFNPVLPRHYFAPMHPRYNPEATYEDFNRTATGIGLMFGEGVPRLSAWYAVQWVQGQRILYERNPYYWKVDTAGNQLPYADALTFTFVPDRNVMLIKFVNGEFDLFGRYASPDLADTLYSERTNSNYTIYYKEPDSGLCIYFDWSDEDPNLRRAFRDKRVRMALSYAVNREEISEIVFNGNVIPGGYSFSPSSPFYDETDYHRYAQYDPAKAADLLDEAGIRDTNGDGMREFEDGSPFEFVMDVGIQTYQVDVAELVVEQWKEAGVKVHLFITREEIHSTRRHSGEFQSCMWHLNGSIDPAQFLSYWSVVRSGEPFWYSTAYDEQPDWLMESTRLFNKASETIDPDQVKELMARVREIFVDKVPAVGLGSLRSIWAASNQLGNVPAEGNFDNLYHGWSRPVFHEQLYFKNP